MTQLTITPHCRSTDPETSRLAAESLSPEKLSRSREAVLRVAKCCDGGFTLAGVVALYNQIRVGTPGLLSVKRDIPRQSDSGIRTRCKELMSLGLIRATGEKVKLASGRWARVLEATK